MREAKARMTRLRRKRRKFRTRKAREGRCSCGDKTQKKDGGSGAKDAELQKLQLKTEELENVKVEQEQKIKELHSVLLMAKKDADERKNKESEETKNKAKEVLKKTMKNTKNLYMV